MRTHTETESEILKQDTPCKYFCHGKEILNLFKSGKSGGKKRIRKIIIIDKGLNPARGIIIVHTYLASIKIAKYTKQKLIDTGET